MATTALSGQGSSTKSRGGHRWLIFDCGSQWLRQLLAALAGAGNAFAVGNITISEVYGGGGNSGATLTNDYIELHNRTASAIDVTGWSVQYGSAAGTTWQVTALSGTIAAGGYYLVQEAAGAGGTTPLPTPDATGSIAMSATAGKVALVTTATALTGVMPARLDT